MMDYINNRLGDLMVGIKSTATRMNQSRWDSCNSIKYSLSIGVY